MQVPATRGEGVVLMLENCRRGHGHSCLIAALEFAPVISPRPDCARAVPLAQQACAGGQKEGCALGEACRMSGAGRAQALQALGQACEQNDGVACFYWAEAGRPPEVSVKQARRAFRLGCMSPVGTLFRRQACGRLGEINLALASTRAEEEAALGLLEKACEDSSGQACCDLAEAQRKRFRGASDPARAAELRDRACALGEQRCCAPPAPK
jgi:TPR repeat protein